MAAAKKVEIIFDINGKAIDVAVQSTLNLQQQVKALTAELRKTKEGTQEFALLNSKLNDAKDNLERVNVKSRDLFASLSLIPGPLGDMFGKLNGVIGLLKTFSGFSLKDVGNQFKELVNDIKDIGRNLLGIKRPDLGPTEAAGAGAGGAAAGGSAAAGAAGTAAAISANTSAKSKLILKDGELVTAEQAAAAAGNKANQTIANGGPAVAAATNAKNALIVSTKAGTVATESDTIAKEGDVVVTTLLTRVTNGLTVAVNTLGTAMKRIGIGLLIAAAAYLITKLIELATEFFKAEDATKRFTKAIQEQNEALEKNISNIEYQKKKAELLAQIAGKSAKDITEISKSYLEQEKQAYSNQIGDLQKLRVDAAKDEKMTKEEKEKTLGEIDGKIKEAAKNYVKTRNQIELDGLTERSKIIEEARNKEKADNKTAKEIDIANRREINSLKLTEERDRQKEEIKNQKLAEEDKIKELHISREKKGQLINQIEEKYGYKLKDLNKKFNEEDIKAAEEFTKKLGQISISAIKYETDNQVAAREEKYRNDLRDLEKDKEFIKMSEEAKAFYRSELKEALDNDVEKIHIDSLVKKHQSELTLLEAQQKNLVAGTQAYLDNSLAIEEEAYQTKLLNAQKNGEDKERIEKEHAENIKAINLAAFEAEKNLQIQRLGVIAGIGQSLQTLAGKNKKLAIAGIIIEKAASIGQIIANTGIANAKAAAVSPLTFGQPWVAINTIAAGLSIAASIKGAADAISQINSADSGSSGGAGATTPAAPNANYGKNYGDGGLLEGPRHAQGGVMINAEGGEAVMTRGAVTMFAPLLSAMNQMGGGTSFSKGAAGQARFDNPKISNTSVAQPQIIKTYVVSSDLTTEQQKQARLKDLSTL
jgi:hypothetical protein